MTDQKLQIKVAELLGWTKCKAVPLGGLRGMTPNEKHTSFGRWDIVVPDYPNDLNACHEMEKALRSGKQMNRVISERDVYRCLLNGKHGNGWEATARQRCEAFVKVMEKRT